ncbi:MAG TPA: tetratricopeptide repeat protein [Candidatus Kapabacteria bacterium]|nr:tetratricopeptide repeat protein [Candidatus Kapabacteria bacterium]
MTSTHRNRPLVTIVLRLLGLLLTWLPIAVSPGEAQDFDRLQGAFLDNPPVWFRLFDERSELPRMPVLDDRSWATRLVLRESEQQIGLSLIGPVDYTMSELLEYYSGSGTLASASAYLDRGLMAFRRREFGRARFYFSEAIGAASKEQSTDAENIAGVALYEIALAHVVEQDQPDEKTIEILHDQLEQYPGSPRERDALYLLGELNSERGDCQAALGFYDKIIDTYPGEGQLDARNHKAACLLQLGRYGEAREQLRMAASMIAEAHGGDTTQPDVRRAWAENHLLLGQLEIAQKNYSAAEESLIALTGDATPRYRRQGMLGLGATYQAAGRNDSALALYNRLLAEDTLDQTHAMALFNKAQVLRALGKGDASLEILQTIAADTLSSENDLALIDLGIADYERRSFADAATAFATAARRAHTDATRIRAATLLGAVKLADNDPAAAIRAFESADVAVAGGNNESLPQSAEARLLRGITLTRAGRSSEAVPVLNRFIEQYPQHPGADQALYWLGESYYESGLFKAAVDAEAQLLEQYPASQHVADALYLLGWAQLRQKNFDKAEAAFSQFAKAYPLSAYAAEAQLRRGDALYLRGRFDDAVDAYRLALKAKPTTDELWYAEYQSALAIYRSGGLESADSLLDEFATCFSGGSLADDAWFLRGEIAARRGNYRDAIEFTNRLLETTTDNDLAVRGLANIGDAYAALGERRMAEAAYAVALSRNPRTDMATELREKTSKLFEGQEGEQVDDGCSHALTLALGRSRILRAANHAAEALKELAAVDRSSIAGDCVQRLWAEVAQDHLRAGDTAAAVDTLRLIIDRFPSTHAALSTMLDLGIVEQQRRNNSAALEVLGRLHSEYADSIEAKAARIPLADLLISAGMHDSALTILHQALGTPQADEALLRLATIETSSPARDSALAGVAAIAGRSDSLGLAASRLLAGLYRTTHDEANAVHVLEDAVARSGPNSIRRKALLLELGETCEAGGDNAKARTIYQNLSQRPCDDAYRTKALEHLQRLPQE